MKIRAWLTGGLAAAAVVLTAGCGAGAVLPAGGVTPGAASSAASTSVAAQATVELGQNASLGSILTNSAGMTLYLYTKDTSTKSNCTGSCAAVWPPLMASGAPTAAPGVQAAVGTISLPGGGKQVTVNGHPVYTYVKDQRPGDATGQGVGGLWFALSPNGDAVGTSGVAGAPQTSSATVQVASNAQLGQILVTSTGMTLYLYTKDAPGASTCLGGCATLWPPLRPPASGTLTAGPGVTGKLSAITRTDGSKQVAINGQPLYTYAADKSPGDVTGQGVGSVWWVVKPNGAENGTQPPAAGAATATGNGY